MDKRRFLKTVFTQRSVFLFIAVYKILQKIVEIKLEKLPGYVILYQSDVKVTAYEKTEKKTRNDYKNEIRQK